MCSPFDEHIAEKQLRLTDYGASSLMLRVNRYLPYRGMRPKDINDRCHPISLGDHVRTIGTCPFGYA
jgi:hypothetical protein